MKRSYRYSTAIGNYARILHDMSMVKINQLKLFLTDARLSQDYGTRGRGSDNTKHKHNMKTQTFRAYRNRKFSASSADD